MPFDLLAWLFWTAVTAGIGYVAGELAKKQPKPPSVEPDELNIPIVDEGARYTIIFGMNWVENPIVAWWGDIGSSAIIRHYSVNRWGNNKRVYYTIGYHYSVGMHMLLTQGQMDGIKQIKVGDVVVWPTLNDPTSLQADGATSATIDEPLAFGGEEEDGGVRGVVDFQYGASSQTQNDYLVSQLGSDISATRGLSAAILRGVIVGVSPQVKPWKFLCKRTDILTGGDAQWYIAKAAIGNNANPAHMLHEILTNTEWGLGYPSTWLPDVEWEAAADTLYTENFGLSRKWESQNESIEDLVKDILRHIDAKLYQDLGTGEIILKLIRDDYDIGSLEEFDDSDVILIEKFTRPAIGEAPNFIQLKYWDIIENAAVAISDHDIALIDMQGGSSIPYTVNYLMVTDDTLAAELGARERYQIGAFPASVIIKAKRTMSHLRPGDVFKLAWPSLDIVQIILRVLSCDYGSSNEMELTLNCAEDVFAVQSALYGAPPDTGWADPKNEPAEALDRKLMEIPFWDIVQDGGISGALALDDDSGFLQVVAKKPSADAYDYELLLRDSPSSSFYSDGAGIFTANGTLSAGMLLNAADATITLTGAEGLYEVLVGDYAVIEDEVLKVTAINAAISQVTLARGCLDTVPAAHSSSTRVWFAGSASYMAGKEYTTGNQPGVKILPRTALGTLAEGDATAYSVDAFDSRMVRPYPPGDFKVNGSSYPASFSGQPTISWKHRDRTQQIDEIIEHDNVSIGPEVGTTYTLSIYDETGVGLLRTVTGITGTSYTYSYDDEIADSGLSSGDPLNSSLRFVLKAVRDSYDSHQSYDVTVPRA